MSEIKKQKIKEQLQRIAERLANAEEYVAQNVNMKGSRLGDWSGYSGHPSWTKNVMIPGWKRQRARSEKALETIDIRTKDKCLRERRGTGQRQPPLI